MDPLYACFIGLEGSSYSQRGAPGDAEAHRRRQRRSWGPWGQSRAIWAVSSAAGCWQGLFRHGGRRGPWNLDGGSMIPADQSGDPGWKSAELGRGRRWKRRLSGLSAHL